MVESPDLEQTVGNLVNQLGEVQQQLTSQEQQFQQLAKKVDDKFDSISSKIQEVLLAKQPGTQPSEDLKTIMEQLLNKQSELFISSLDDHKKTSAEETKKNIDDLKANVDEKFASVSHDVKKTFESQARQIASIEEAQQRQEQAIAAFTTFAKDIGATKLQPTDGVHVDDSWEVSQSPTAKPPTMHETYLAGRRKGFSSTPFVPTSKATRPSFGATRTIFKPTDSTENKAGTTTMNNDSSYVAVSQPTTG